MSKASAARPPRGRPRQDTLAARERALLDAAAGLFLQHGYGATPLEAVVQAAGISKRTLYQRYPDKAALFAAVLEHIIGQLRPPAEVPLIQGDCLEVVLERIAGFMLHAALQPAALALQRLLIAESGRFPEIGRMLAENSSVRQANSLVAGLLREADVAALPAEFLATQFLQLVVAHPQRAAMGLAPPLSPDQCAAWPRLSVALFLRGVAAPR